MRFCLATKGFVELSPDFPWLLVKVFANMSEVFLLGVPKTLLNHVSELAVEFPVRSFSGPSILPHIIVPGFHQCSYIVSDPQGTGLFPPYSD